MFQNNNIMNVTYNTYTKKNTVDIIILYNLYNFDFINLWLLIDFDNIEASKIIIN